MEKIRKLDTSECPARVLTLSEFSASNIPCRRAAEHNKCHKDTVRSDGARAAAIGGQCLADQIDKVVDPYTPDTLLEYAQRNSTPGLADRISYYINSDQ